MHRVRFQPSGRSAVVPAGTTLLAAAQEAGLPVARACGGDGLCARCGLCVLAGAETLEPETSAEREAKRDNRVSEALRLACRARVHGDIEVTASYW